MSKSRFMKKFLAILVFGFCNLNICASAAMEEKSGQMLVVTSKKTVPNLDFNPQNLQEFLRMKSLVEELAQRSFTGNSMCDFVTFGKSFLKTKEQLEKTQNENQTMENKIAELNANIRELQIRLDRLTQGIELLQKEKEELKKSLAEEKEKSKDYNSSKEFLAKYSNTKILKRFLILTLQEEILDPSASGINLLYILSKMISGMLHAESWIHQLYRENVSLSSVINKLMQRGEEESDRGRFLLNVISSSSRRNEYDEPVDLYTSHTINQGRLQERLYDVHDTINDAAMEAIERSMLDENGYSKKAKDEAIRYCLEGIGFRRI
ncbi:MAG: hypothetical protein CfP315_0845 [Candidatus Improbicoccus pseudotrichonymphae]|uniref:Uncharacterized protein n=1 Tax=Candidatus Improbicoccus pseudotrichonymphae TaxID=3033792 RepID=A0AA48HVP8_9FIRM|nr:MAG: hypothetical protein CfP315_0845 [Candidatus Improbicoccus pseudotrichonymphae]